MSASNISWGKGGRCVGLTLPFNVPNFMQSVSLKLLEPSGRVHELLYFACVC